MNDKELQDIHCLLKIREIVEDEPGKLMQDELVERIRELKNGSTCDWSQEDPEADGPWETDCGHYFNFTDPDDTPDNVFQYCPYCGGKITCSTT